MNNTDLDLEYIILNIKNKLKLYNLIMNKLDVSSIFKCSESYIDKIRNTYRNFFGCSLALGLTALS